MDTTPSPTTPSPTLTSGAAASQEVVDDTMEAAHPPGFLERNRNSIIITSIFLSLLLGLLIYYVPGAREAAELTAANISEHNSSWSVFFGISNIQKIEKIDAILLKIPNGVIKFLSSIRDIVPVLYESVESILTGAQKGIGSTSPTTIMLTLIGKLGVLDMYNNLYNYLKRPRTKPVSGNIVPDDLDEELMEYYKLENEKLDHGLSIQDDEALGTLYARIGGGSIRKKISRKTKKQFSKKTKKNVRNKRALSKNDVVQINRLKDDI